MKKQYTVNGKLYRTQSELENTIKKELNSYPLNIEFYSEFLASVINEHHHEVIEEQQRSSGRFLYLDYMEQVRRGMDTASRWRGGKLLMTFFEPLGEWRDVTVYPWRRTTNENEIKRALREKIAPHIPRPGEGDKYSHPECSAKGSLLEYEHASPTFDEIANECIKLMSKEEIDARFGYKKFAPNTVTNSDFIPDDHPAVKRLIELHQTNSWVWLCKYHHRNVGKKA